MVRHGAEDKDITVAWVPGAFEVPMAAQKMAKTKSYDALICLGTVIRGGRRIRLYRLGGRQGWPRFPG
jgi:6,7-dimethyl-8-ribityllumazine synthase